MKIPHLAPFFSLILLPGSLFAQGNLTPPGAPAPTMKTLDQLEPRIEISAANTPGDADSLYKITQPGSYHLTKNLTGVSGKNGIEIAASNVTLDLNGFELVGIESSFKDGITVQVAGISNVAVLNGSIVNWSRGVTFVAVQVANSRVANVRASSNSTTGIYVGIGGLIQDCIASNNGVGFHGAAGSRVVNCVASTSFSVGIEVDQGGSVMGCSAYNTNGFGFIADDGSSVSECVAQHNVNGISVGNGCVVRGNTFTDNGNFGILISGNDNRIEGNHCSGSPHGISINFGASRNRIDRNSVNSCGVGFDIGGSDNLVIRNTASGSSPNYSVTAGNSVAPRVSVANSDGWAGITNANHPFANLGY